MCSIVSHLLCMRAVNDNVEKKKKKKLQKVREQGIRFWDESIFWHEIILKV